MERTSPTRAFLLENLNIHEPMARALPRGRPFITLDSTRV